MATQHYILGQGGSSNQFGFGETQYFIVRNSSYGSGGRPTELDAQATTMVAGTYSQWYMRVVSNTINTGNTVFTSRKNTADGNISISVVASVAGDVFDLTNTDTVAVNDVYNMRVVVSGASGTLNCNSTIGFISASATFEQATFGAGTLNTASTTNYYFPVGSYAPNATETDVQVKIKNAVTVNKLQIRNTTNTKVADVTLTSRKNTAAGNMSVPITAGVTNLYSDPVNSDSLVAGDLYNWAVTTGAGAGTYSSTLIQAQWTYSDGTYDIFATSGTAGGIARAASPTQSFVVPLGSLFSTFSATNTARRQYIPYAVTISKFSCNVTAYTYSVAGTANVSKNGANGNGTVPVSATGVVEDATNSDSFIPGDFLAYGVTGGSTGSATFIWFGAQIVDKYPVKGNGNIPTLIKMQAVNRASTY